MDKQGPQLSLYEKMYLIRSAENEIKENYFDDEMKTPMHMSMGEEAIVVGACSALDKKDQIFGTFRSHGIYLAKTGETDGFFAEFYGKESGACKGKGGSMHLINPEYGFMGTSAIVSGIIPTAVGCAFANKIQKNGKVVIVFLGDGATEEGDFWESINIASLMKLDIVFLCEDNGLAVYTDKSSRKGYKSISEIVSKFDIKVIGSKSTDVDIIYELMSDCVNDIRQNGGPYFAHMEYYRYLDHVGTTEDFGSGYRDKKEFLKWYKNDPIAIKRNKLISMGLKEEFICNIEAGITSKVQESLAKAKESKFPLDSDLLKEVFSE